jgi:hypothetical protein
MILLTNLNKIIMLMTKLLGSNYDCLSIVIHILRDRISMIKMYPI